MLIYSAAPSASNAARSKALCAGDPATDLSAAWLLLPDGAAEPFREAYGREDQAAISRARGWTLERVSLAGAVTDGLAGVVDAGRVRWPATMVSVVRIAAWRVALSIEHLMWPFGVRLFWVGAASSGRRGWEVWPLNCAAMESIWARPTR
ncbi:hypothetical protein ABZ540_11105 [Nocardia xishanensis]|uniref:hypothetical protein n=1 Tax=Nocardia xishanensis TaxID=238964 RepID=UPI0033D922D6